MKRLNISVLFIACLLMFVVKVTADQHLMVHRGSQQMHANFIKHKSTILDVVPIISEKVEDVMSCMFSCLKTALCISFNVAAVPDADKYDCQLLATDKYNSANRLKSSKEFNHYSIVKNPCKSSPCQNGGTCHPVYEKQEYKCECAAEFSGTHCQDFTGRKSCGDLLKAGDKRDGEYKLLVQEQNFKVYCDMTDDNKAWTLIARFSNSDTKNWMKDSGEYWYDRKSSVGQTTNPADNTDMISPAFWSVKGTELKITRSDDITHTALLHTTGECLGGQTFRSKMTSYGDFRNSKIWAENKCLGSCDVQYGGQYKTTEGFVNAECDGKIQQRNKIGFWCDYGSGDGAVLTIGGAGTVGNCKRTDHGIGVTDADEACFKHDRHYGHYPYEGEYDFGNNANTNIPPSRSYSLNVWIQ